MSVVRDVHRCEAGGLPTDGGETVGGSTYYERLKRVIDVGVSCLLLVLLAPLLLLAALAIKLTSRGPVLYRGTVIGRYGRPFTYYKLRSMVTDGDDAAHRRFIREYVADGSRRSSRGAGCWVLGAETPSRPSTQHPAPSTQHRVYKLTEDPRITPVGRILRKTSLDEVAQVINVLRGEMSLVGPRPPVPYEYGLYDAYHHRRLAVLPGITGLAQVRARSRASFEEMVAMDLEYIRHRSIWGDLILMARTVWVVLSAKGAH